MYEVTKDAAGKFGFRVKSGAQIVKGLASEDIARGELATYQALRHGVSSGPIDAALAALVMV